MATNPNGTQAPSPPEHEDRTVGPNRFPPHWQKLVATIYAWRRAAAELTGEDAEHATIGWETLEVVLLLSSRRNDAGLKAVRNAARAAVGLPAPTRELRPDAERLEETMAADLQSDAVKRYLHPYAGPKLSEAEKTNVVTELATTFFKAVFAPTGTPIAGEGPIARELRRTAKIASLIDSLEVYVGSSDPDERQREDKFRKRPGVPKRSDREPNPECVEIVNSLGVAFASVLDRAREMDKEEKLARRLVNAGLKALGYTKDAFGAAGRSEQPSRRKNA